MNINEHRPTLIAYLTPRLRGNHQQAVEIADYAVAQVRENIDRLKPGADPVAWLYSIADSKGKEAVQGLASRRT